MKPANIEVASDGTISTEEWPPNDAPQPVKVTTIKVSRGEYMRESDGGTGIFDPGQRTVLPGNRPKRGKFMES